MKNYKFLVVDSQSAGYNWLFNVYGTVTNATHNNVTANDVTNADIVVLTGGSDVSPHLYGEEKLDTTYCNPERDKNEQVIWNNAILNKKPIIGICRGAQFGNVMSGGKLLQHISGHTGAPSHRHFMKTMEGGYTMRVSSDHHQAIVPPANIGHEVLGRANDDSIIEVIYVPDNKFLGFQYHPEWMTSTDLGVLYFDFLMKKLLFTPATYMSWSEYQTKHIGHRTIYLPPSSGSTTCTTTSTNEEEFELPKDNIAKEIV